MKEYLERIKYVLKLPDKIFENFINKFSSKTKEIILKGWIVWNCVYLILFLYFGNKYQHYNNFEPIIFFFTFLLLLNLWFIFYLGSKIEIKHENIKPIIKMHEFNDYNIFKNELINSLHKIKFNNEIQLDFKKQNEESTIIFNDRINRTFVTQLISLKNFGENKIDNYTELFWNETVKYVGESKIQRRFIYLIQFICVEEENNTFIKFMKYNLPQDEKRYQIIIGLSLKTKKVYIAQSKDRFYSQYYYELLSLVEKLTESIFFETDSLKKNSE